MSRGRRALDRALLAAAVIAPLLWVVAGIVIYRTRHSAELARFLALYVAPIFGAAPLWIRERLAHRPPLPLRVWLIDGLVVALSAIRFVVGPALPFSGHMLFLTYSGLVSRRRGYRWLALVLIAETTVFKFWEWHDPGSWAVGLAVGVVAALVARMSSRA